METNNKKTTEYNIAATDLVYLAGCAVNRLTPDVERARGNDVDRLYEIAEKHGLLSTVAYALESAGINNERFRKAKANSMRREVLFEAERRRIFSRFDELGLWYMPLKGSVLRKDYPAFGMREMSDNDVLCDPSRMEDVREVMESLGFECTQFEGELHDIYVKSPSLIFEMHPHLIGERKHPDIYDYYSDVKSKLVPDGNGTCGYHFTPEDFYIFIIVHEYKHVKFAGAGIRALLDIYVYLTIHGSELDKSYIEAELEKISLCDFERNNRELAFRIFSPEYLGEPLPEELNYYLDSTLYGTDDRRKYNRLDFRLKGDDSASSKLKYILSKVFPRGKELEQRFPFFYRHKILIPFLYVFRVFQVFFHIGILRKELKGISEFKVGQVDEPPLK